jgi:hypothetical protein
MAINEKQNNTLEHVLDLTNRSEITWTLTKSEYKKCIFESNLDEYDLQLRISKSQNNNISFFLYIEFIGTGKNLEDNQESIYVSNINHNKFSSELLSGIFTKHNFEWCVKKETVIESFLNDTARPMMREKTIDKILDGIKNTIKIN